MPIEIRELVIRATVNPETPVGRLASAAAPARERSGAAPAEDLVQRCVREVLRVLDEKRER